MKYRTLGTTGWPVSEIGCGMWGMGDWSDSNDNESLQSLETAVDLGCNFFDTALAYGDGHSERLLGEILRRHPQKKLYVATKIPPKNSQWPAQRGSRLEDVFPPDYIRAMTETSLRNLGVDCIDLQQFHVWQDAWAHDRQWQQTIDDLKREGLIRAVGVSINRWEPWNVLETLRTGLIEAVQVIYNIFDQSPEDELFPLCRERNVGVIARVPLDEGGLTGTLTTKSRWPAGDWRNSYFGAENLSATVARAERIRPLVPEGMTMAELALRWILAEPAVSTIIPGMRKNKHVRSNIAVSDGQRLPDSLMQELKCHRWDRRPATWSD
jgi:aryl-alcohol dehydrogenase-like predicted oxidoreductase